MSDTFGLLLKLTIFGESHGPAIGAVLTGLPAGLPLDMKRLEADMDRRRAKGRISTQRHEPDQVQVLSGVFEGHTAGTAVTFLIENKAQRSGDYDQLKYRLRPGHADLAAFARYEGWQDYRGGGHFSGRITAGLVAAGSLCRQILERRESGLLRTSNGCTDCRIVPLTLPALTGKWIWRRAWSSGCWIQRKPQRCSG